MNLTKLKKIKIHLKQVLNQCGKKQKPGDV